MNQVEIQKSILKIFREKPKINITKYVSEQKAQKPS
jgi:hypothetical protein